jgi:membrane-bound lytic murein transglycosylase B
MPRNIKKYGVDYDGVGGVNLCTPVDAIGSVANYLNKHGWRRGEIAAIPATRTGGYGYASMRSGFKHKHSLATLERNGLKPSYPGVSGQVNMVKLNVTGGEEYWIGGNNFYVITRYNHSNHYAMAVHQLAQEIKKRVKPGQVRTPLLEASRDKDLLMRAAGRLL